MTGGCTSGSSYIGVCGARGPGPGCPADLGQCPPMAPGSCQAGLQPSLAHMQVSQQHVKLLRIPSFLPSPEEPPLPPAPSEAKSGSLDSELSLSPKRNSISRTQKDKGPFHILSSTSQTSKAPEGPSPTPVSALSSSTRLFGLAKPKDKKEKKKKSKGGRSQSGGESRARLLVSALSLHPEQGWLVVAWDGLETGGV